jgi:hypothetical protein
MAEERSLTIVEQKEVAFYGDELVAVRSAGGDIYVSFRHLCDALGLDRPSQMRRVRRHTILEPGYQRGVIMTPHRGDQEAAFLRVDLVPLWLTTLDTKRVKDEARPKLERYQREAADVLWQAFQEGRLTSSPTFDELLAADTPAVRAYKAALAIVDLARQQILMEARLTDTERRLELIEAQLGDPGRAITPEQAATLSQAVKAVAMALGKKSGRNEYGGVYGELYRRFDIAGYKQLPARRFQTAMDWLNEWYQNVTGTPLPF